MSSVDRQFKLSELLKEVVEVAPEQDCSITGIAIDSRIINKGELFLAYKGEDLDGHDFIFDAINKGAIAIICEKELSQENLPKAVPVIVIPDLRWQVGLIAAKFYDYPSRKLAMIGVTGTNGKTSVTHFTAALLTQLGITCGIIGTNGIGYPGELETTITTTPDPVVLHKMLFDFVNSGAKAVAMEVSSQGLVQGRVSGVDFGIAVFTNLTHEHLDYHKTMKDYWEAKKILFLHNNIKHAVINGDDEYGRSLIEELKDSMDLYAYTLSEDSTYGVTTIRAKNIEIIPPITAAHVITPWGEGELKTHLLGRFNISNLLATVTIIGIMQNCHCTHGVGEKQLNINDAFEMIPKLEPIKGRMEVFGGRDKKPTVIVDFSHSPDALEKALIAAREYCHGSLWCVFGCGGDRDKSKRPLMGAIAERLSDHVVITNDNPRTEDQKLIVDDILEGLLCPWAIEIEYDRTTAIEYAVHAAGENDLIIITGKGHEDYQIIGTKKLDFSDQEVVIKALESRI